MKIATLPAGGPWAASSLRVVHDTTLCRECRQRPPQWLWNRAYPVCDPCLKDITQDIERKRHAARHPD
jgi:hypothetical protein